MLLQVRCLALAVVAVQLVASAGAATCPQMRLFVRWLTEFERVCRPPSTASLGNGTHGAAGLEQNKPNTQADCSWVGCDCLEVSLQVPVRLELIAPCYEEGHRRSRFTEDQRRLASELIRGTACGDRSRLMASNCGECDRFAKERPQCSFTTKAPLRLFISSDGRLLPG